jgi:hypothetical protein
MPAADPAAGSRALLLASALAGLVSLSLVVSACSGSPRSRVAQVGSTATQSSRSSTAPGGSTNAGGSANPRLLAFSRCMRSKGVPNFPDLEPGAGNAKFRGAQQLGVGSSQLSAAENGCQHLLPAGIDDRFPQTEVQLLLGGIPIG